MALLRFVGKLLTAAVVGPTFCAAIVTAAVGVLYGLGWGVRSLGIATCEGGDCILVGFITTMFASGFTLIVFLAYEILWGE